GHRAFFGDLAPLGDCHEPAAGELRGRVEGGPALVHDFFRGIDDGWTGAEPGKIRLSIIGCSALMLQTGYERGTKDSDVLETRDLTDPVKKRVLALAGRGTDLHKKYGMYIELVPSGLPFLPQVALYHEQVTLNADLKHFRAGDPGRSRRGRVQAG